MDISVIRSRFNENEKSGFSRWSVGVWLLVIISRKLVCCGCVSQRRQRLIHFQSTVTVILIKQQNHHIKIVNWKTQRFVGNGNL